MKTYEAIFEPDKNKGVYAISLVENPAMEGTFIALAETKVQFKTIDNEKRILAGLVLEPNKPIYRNSNGEEYNIVFSDQTVADLCYGFSKNKYHSNSSIEHNENQVIEGVTFVENWLVRDDKMDTSVALGLDCKKNSWVSVLKVDSDEVWNDYVKTGKVQGFSIDAMLSLKEVNLKSEIKMSKTEENSLIQFLKELPEKIALALKGDPKDIEVNLGKIKPLSGDFDINFEGDELTVDGKVWMIAEDGTEVPMPVGDYELEDNRILVVEVEGIAKEIKEVVADEEAPAEQQPAEMTAKETDATAKAIENAIKSIMIKYASENDAKIEAIKTELKADYDKQIIELGSQPARKPIATVATPSAPKNAKERILETIQKTTNS